MEEKIYDPLLKEGIYLPEISVIILNDISKWTKFLSILGFVFLSIMIISLLSAVAFTTTMNYYAEMTRMHPYNPGMFQWYNIVIYLIVFCIYFFPVYFLYKFSIRIRKAIAIKDTDVLINALGFLRKHYLFLGILAIVGIVLAIIGFSFMLLGFLAYI